MYNFRNGQAKSAFGDPALEYPAIGFEERVCEDDEFVHDGGQGDLRWLSGFDELCVLGLHVGIEARAATSAGI